jgi:hypothetical protein
LWGEKNSVIKDENVEEKVEVEKKAKTKIISIASSF